MAGAARLAICKERPRTRRIYSRAVTKHLLSLRAFEYSSSSVLLLFLRLCCCPFPPFLPPCLSFCIFLSARSVPILARSLPPFLQSFLRPSAPSSFSAFVYHSLIFRYLIYSRRICLRPSYSVYCLRASTRSRTWYSRYLDEERRNEES